MGLVYEFFILINIFILFLNFKEEFSKRKKEKNIVDFHDIEHLALKILIDENGNPTEIAKKYASNNSITITKHPLFGDDYYINFEVDSLEFLPKLEQDLFNIYGTEYLLIFCTIDENTYGINIYNGYLD